MAGKRCGCSFWTVCALHAPEESREIAIGLLAVLAVVIGMYAWMFIEGAKYHGG